MSGFPTPRRRRQEGDEVSYASTAESWPGARIPEFVRNLMTAAIAVISRDCILIDANRGFFNLVPESMTAADMLDVRDLFISPRFEEFAIRSPARPGGAIYDGIFNVGSIDDAVISLRGSVYAQSDSVLLVAEHEVAQLDLLRARLLRLNDELATEQRRLAAALREIKRQRSRADDAVRDRDAIRALAQSDLGHPLSSSQGLVEASLTETARTTAERAHSGNPAD